MTIQEDPLLRENGFLFLTKKDEDEHTRLMYYDGNRLTVSVLYLRFFNRFITLSIGMRTLLQDTTAAS